MGTNAYIGFEHDNGVIELVYCHFDGYPSHTGRILFEHYDLERTKELVSMGDMSYLGRYMYSSESDNESDVCVFYSRDRGEELSKPYAFDGYHDISKSLPSDYIYVIDKSGIWQFRYSKNKWHPLSEIDLTL